MEEKISREKFKIEGENGYIRIKKPFITPSAFLIGLLLFFDRYFKKHSPSYKYSHGTSLWISKPCAGSKGYGINIL